MFFAECSCLRSCRVGRCPLRASETLTRPASVPLERECPARNGSYIPNLPKNLQKGGQKRILEHPLYP